MLASVFDGRYTWTDYTFGSDVNACVGEAFFDVTGDGVCDSPADQCVFQDRYTGQEIASTLSSGVLMTWEEAIMHCAGLTWNGQTGWYLPTRSEAYQAVIDGVGFLSDAYTYFPTYELVHTSTTQATLISNSHQVNLRDGSVAKADKSVGGTARRKAACVRNP